MKEFVLLFRYTPNEEYQPTEQEMAEDGQRWGEYIGGLAQNGQFVTTSQFGFEGLSFSNENEAEGMVFGADGTIVSGFMVIKANNIEEAKELAKGCPVLNYGATIEVRDTIPMD